MVEGIIAAIVGIVAGVGGKVVYDRQQETKSKNTAEQVIAQAERKASDIVLKEAPETFSTDCTFNVPAFSLSSSFSTISLFWSALLSCSGARNRDMLKRVTKPFRSSSNSRSMGLPSHLPL